jgi:hypothetical protein
MNDELEGPGKEAVVSYLIVLSLPGGVEKKPQSRQSMS